MKRKALSWLLSLCLIVGLLPTAALAAENEPEEAPSLVCTCEDLCTDEASNPDCLVCANGITDCKGETSADEEDPTALEPLQEENAAQEEGGEDTSANESAALTRAVLAEKIYSKFQDSIGGNGTDASFTDISSCTEDQQKAISAVAAAGIVSGTSADTFGPEGTVTRAEAVVVLWRALGCPSNTKAATVSYSDVNMGDWYSPAIHCLTAMGILQGGASGTFNPSQVTTVGTLDALLQKCDSASETDTVTGAVSRVEMLMEFYAHFKDGPLQAVYESKKTSYGETKFTDTGSCTEAQREAILFFEVLGIVNGYKPGEDTQNENWFVPYAPASNLQIAMLLQRCAKLAESTQTLMMRSAVPLSDDVALLADTTEDKQQQAINAAFAFLSEQGAKVEDAQANPHAPGLAVDLTAWNNSLVPDVPTISPQNGVTFTDSLSVTITAGTEDDGTVIYYTTDGKEPTTESTLYTAAITVTNTTTIKAIAVKNNLASKVASATYTIDIPTLTITPSTSAFPGGGTVELTVRNASGEVTVTCDDSEIIVEGNGNTWTASLPNISKTYTFSVTDESGNRATCTVSVTRRSSGGGGSSSGGSSSSNTTTETVTNKDGSTTTTVTDKKTGTTTETTKYKDGSTLAIVTEKNGAVTTTETRADGVKVKTVDEPGEDVTAAVTIPRSVGETTVTIPADVDYRMVAVDANTGEIVKLSVPTRDGMTVKLDGSADLVLVDNAKDFTDTRNHWAEDAIDFAAAHELFAGTSETTFTPDSPMTRAMLMTVLARFDGEDTTGGSVWYEKGMAWAVANGVSDGSNPNGSITREQFATMLWRYTGSPTVSGSLTGFSDHASVSGYATDAMRWAVSNGIIGGMGDGTLAPQGNATRAQVATMLMRFVENMTK